MTVAGICMVKDEEDIIGWTLPRMTRQLDFIIVADNMSTDRTRPILEKVARTKNVIVIDDYDPAYTQSEKMTNLALLAKERGAEWVVPFDADEVWTTPSGHIADMLSQVGSEYGLLTAALWDHVPTARDDQGNPDVINRIGWRRSSKTPLHKVACRTLPGLVIEQGNHQARFPGHVGALWDQLDVHHFPYRSAQQMVRKAHNGAAAYKAAGNRIPAEYGKHWRDYGTLLDTCGPAAIHEVFHTWFYSPDPDNDPELTYDPVPPL